MVRKPLRNWARNVHRYLNSVGKSSTAIQYTRFIPILEKASNTDAITRFCIEDVMKYKNAADTPDSMKLDTRDKTIISYFTVAVDVVYVTGTSKFNRFHRCVNCTFSDYLL